MVGEEALTYGTNSPSFASSPEEIRIAVEQNALDRGILLIKVIVSLQVDKVLSLVEGLGQSYDKEDFCELANEIGVDKAALRIIDDVNLPVSYLCYFCTPDLLVEHPELVFYYRNMAMLSRKVMRGIGLDTSSVEDAGERPSPQMARELAVYFNTIVSALLKGAGTITPYRHVVMMMGNVGDALGGVSRNEVGRVAMMRILNPLVARLHSRGFLASIAYSLKGQITLDDDDSGAEERKWIEITPHTNVQELLDRFETYRVLYHELRMVNGSRLLLNAQLKWVDPITGETYKVGPDLHSHVGDTDLLWAGELKGGADPAGSDEHWKTATEALRRITDAARRTDRRKPQLSFIAAILVDRVARAAQSWIDNGDLTSVYNLTQMYEKREEMDRYLNDMVRFLGCQG